MNALYRVLGYSKQAFHKKLDREKIRLSKKRHLLSMIYKIRRDHPTMGCRDMYYKLQPENIGRDAFELFCKNEGLVVPKVKNYRKTTDSSGVIRFENLTEQLSVTKVNQLWQSDITYFELNNRFYYITFIIDAYSRKIVGHFTSDRLKTEKTTIPALKMALKDRKSCLKGLIFHSDGGGQYYDKEFLKLTQKEGFQNSMCEYPWENGKAERINGVIKNNYLIHRNINTFEALQKEVDRSVLLYNSEKLHIKLQRNTPDSFEKAYFCNDPKIDAENSTPESNYKPGGYCSPAGCNPKINTSNLAMECNSKKKCKTVNLI
jgi:transposase InsO family protein